MSELPFVVPLFIYLSSSFFSLQPCSFLFSLPVFLLLPIFYFYLQPPTNLQPTSNQSPASSHHSLFSSHIAHHASFTLHLLLPTILLSLHLTIDFSPPFTIASVLLASFTLLSIPSGVLRCTSIFLTALLWGEG